MERVYQCPPVLIVFAFSLFCMLMATGCVYNTIVEEPFEELPVEEPVPYYVAIEASLASIQDSLFSGTCQNSRCHDCCWNAAELDLSRGKSYQELVGVPSMQDPSVMLVKPGDPDNSYLIWKLEGHPDMRGALMPIWSTDATLDKRVIQVIRDWIAAGAREHEVEEEL